MSWKLRSALSELYPWHTGAGYDLLMDWLDICEKYMNKTDWYVGCKENAREIRRVIYAYRRTVQNREDTRVCNCSNNIRWYTSKYVPIGDCIRVDYIEVPTECQGATPRKCKHDNKRDRDLNKAFWDYSWENIRRRGHRW